MPTPEPNPRNASPDRISISETIRSLARQRRQRYQAALRRRLAVDYTLDEFLALMKAHAEVAMAERGEFADFRIDQDNGGVLCELHKYAVMDPAFGGNLFRGIALIGRFGCGKSLILEAYARLLNDFIRQRGLRAVPVAFKTSHEVYRAARQGITNAMIFTPLVIDEIGREPKVAKEYGNESTPLIELLHERHRRGVTTHATGNFRPETLAREEMYGPMLGDRLGQMFNFIELKGGSRR